MMNYHMSDQTAAADYANSTAASQVALHNNYFGEWTNNTGCFYDINTPLSDCAVTSPTYDLESQLRSNSYSKYSHASARGSPDSSTEKQVRFKNVRRPSPLEELDPFDPRQGDPDIHWSMYYNFEVTKNDSFWIIKPGYLASSDFPKVRSVEKVTDPTTGKVVYACRYPSCKTAKPFTRCWDLRRHFDTHEDGTLDSQASSSAKYPCDYEVCASSRNFNPFKRKDHCREHYRDVHYEDLLKRKTTGGSDVRKWLKERQVHESWWRCTKCLRRVKVRDQTWICGSCDLPCEEERVAARRDQIKEAGERSMNSRSMSMPIRTPSRSKTSFPTSIPQNQRKMISSPYRQAHPKPSSSPPINNHRRSSDSALTYATNQTATPDTSTYATEMDFNFDDGALSSYPSRISEFSSTNAVDTKHNSMPSHTAITAWAMHPMGSEVSTPFGVGSAPVYPASTGTALYSAGPWDGFGHRGGFSQESAYYSGSSL